MYCGINSLSPRRGFTVSHQIVDIVKERPSRGEKPVSEQVNVEVRHCNRVDTRR
jgi:hypothetical protein